MLLEFIDLNSFPVVSFNCDNQNVLRIEKYYTARLENEKKDNTEFRTQ